MADLVRVAKVFAHELLDGQQSGDRLVAQRAGQPQLLAPREHVGDLPGVKVQVVAQPEEKLAGALEAEEVVLVQDAGVVKLARIGRSMADEADPAEQLHVPQPALRPLDVRLQKEDGFAEAGALRHPRADDRRRQAPASPLHLPAEGVAEPLEEGLAAAEEPRLHQRRADRRIAPGQPAGLPRRADAVPENQADVEDVAEQAFGQRGHAGSRRAGAKIIRSTSLYGATSRRP